MNIYDFTVKDNKGNEVSLEQYKGKVLLVVNTATKCGLTPQYEALEKLYEKYNGQGFEILDFPCNQFKEQAPESDQEIESFCQMNYGTKFPRFAKIDVNGENAAPLYKWLKEVAQVDKSNEGTKEFENLVKDLSDFKGSSDIKWNFGKFLIDKNGEVVERYSPAITPEQVDADIAKVL